MAFGKYACSRAREVGEPEERRTTSWPCGKKQSSRRLKRVSRRSPDCMLRPARRAQHYAFFYCRILYSQSYTSLGGSPSSSFHCSAGFHEQCAMLSPRYCIIKRIVATSFLRDVNLFLAIIYENVVSQCPFLSLQMQHPSYRYDTFPMVSVFRAPISLPLRNQFLNKRSTPECLFRPRVVYSQDSSLQYPGNPLRAHPSDGSLPPCFRRATDKWIGYFLEGGDPRLVSVDRKLNDANNH